MGSRADLPDSPADYDDLPGDQHQAIMHVLDWFRAVPWSHLPARSRQFPSEAPVDAADRPGPYRDRQTGKFARRPDPEPIPEDDSVLSLADAMVSAARGTSRLGATGRDVMRERMQTPRPVPRPVAETPFVNEITFPGRPVPSPDGNPQRWRRAWRRSQGR